MRALMLACKAPLAPYYEKFGFALLGASASAHGGASWLDMALAAKALPADAFTAGKVAACRFFFEQEMPRVALWLDLAAGSDIANALDVEGF